MHKYPPQTLHIPLQTLKPQANVINIKNISKKLAVLGDVITCQKDQKARVASEFNTTVNKQSKKILNWLKEINLIDKYY